MWAWLPDVVVEHLSELAPPVALPTLALLERRSHAATAARLTCLARLRAPPFSLHARKILGLSAETRQRLGANNIGDAGLAALASAAVGRCRSFSGSRSTTIRSVTRG